MLVVEGAHGSVRNRLGRQPREELRARQVGRGGFERQHAVVEPLRHLGLDERRAFERQLEVELAHLGRVLALGLLDRRRHGGIDIRAGDRFAADKGRNVGGVGGEASDRKRRREEDGTE